jgi:protein phosphatase
MQINIPEYCLVVLIGPSGAGKSSFARQHFLPGEILSSDEFRRLVGNDENRLDLGDDAFDVLFYILQKRLDRGLLTVIDATNVQMDDRKKLIAFARKNHLFPVAIVLDTAPQICFERNQNRAERAHLSYDVPKRQNFALRRSIGGLYKEGFRFVYHLRTPEEVAAVQVVRQPLLFNKKHERGPFDIIGDIHGCFDELIGLLRMLGWKVVKDKVTGHFTTQHSQGRKVIFVGDYTDRGPDSPQVLRLVMDMAAAGHAFCVPGNHDAKLQRWIEGRDVQITHGLQHTVEQLAEYPDEFKQEVRTFIDGLVSHLIFDEGRLVVAHAGIKEKYIGRTSSKVREFCLYGDTTGETDEYGLPVRLNWAADYRGPATIVYGHTPTLEAEWLNNTICVDTGCVFGGKLTALRYPERILLSVPAKQEYYAPKRPLVPKTGASSLQTQFDDLLDAQDLLSNQYIETQLMGRLKIREAEAAAAFEALSRFTVHPQWLIYLPPTMSPTETAALPDLLEHPTQAFEYFRQNGIETVVCQEKHMGSRAILVICKDDAVAARRFGVTDAVAVCYTRTGRRFFNDEAMESAFFHSVRATLDQADFWEKYETDWVCLDAELMPWSAKAQVLIERQYATVGSAAERSLARLAEQLELAKTRQPEVAALLDRVRQRQACTAAFSTAYRQYCWPVQSVADLTLAPFHLLAVDGRTFFDRDHVWHQQALADIAAASTDGVWTATRAMTVQTQDADSVAAATAWWETMTAVGGEGIVVKPLNFVERTDKGLIQPALKVRGREYLRIIYGPEYTLPEHIERLRSRGLSKKRSMALREFALGVEGLNRFVQREPLRRVHECVFGVLAIEQVDGDPRL